MNLASTVALARRFQSPSRAGRAANHGVNTPCHSRGAPSIMMFIVIRIHQVEIAGPMVFPVQIKLAPDQSDPGFNPLIGLDESARERVGPEGWCETPGTNRWDLNQ